MSDAKKNKPRRKIIRAGRILYKAYEYYRYLLPFTRANRTRQHLTGDNIISVFSDPRSGSTWVSDIFCKLPDSMLIYEPLFMIPEYREIKDLGFCFHQYIPEDAEWPEAIEFFRKLYNMEVGSPGSFRLYFANRTLKNIKSAKYFVYKDCCSNMLLPWLTARFNVNPVYIIRHPCAVIASQLKNWGWEYAIKDPKAYFPDPKYRFKEIFFQYQDIIDKISRPEERLAAEWALHNSVPIKHPLNDIRWITVPYEKLYLHPEPELNRIFGRLKIEMPEEVLKGIRNPSMTTGGDSSSHIRSGNQLESWRKSLSTQQVRNIMSIIREFGMDFYDESTEPDYSRIYAAPVQIG
jgi:Sulfotransferase family